MFRYLNKNRRFALLVLITMINQIGTFFSYMLMILLAMEKTKSLSGTMGIIVCSSVGALLSGMVSGVFVDRWQPTKVAIVGNIVSGVTIGSLFFLPTHPLNYYVAVFIIAVSSSFSSPAFSKLNFHIVGKEDMLQANTSMQMVKELCKIIGPGLAALVLGILPEQWKGLGFLIDAATYGTAALLLVIGFWTVRLPKDDAKQVEQSAWQQFKQDWQEGWQPFKNPVILSILILLFVIVMSISGFDVILSAHLLGAKQPVIYVGYVVSALSAAIILASMFGKKLVAKWTLAWRLGGSATFIGLCLIGFSFTTNIWLLITIAFALGVMNAVFNFSSPTYFYEAVEQSVMGRFFSLLGSIMSVIGIIGMMASGAIGSMFSPSTVFLLGGVTIVTIGFISIVMISRATKAEKETTLAS